MLSTPPRLPLTLVVGGTGIVLATIEPLLAQATWVITPIGHSQLFVFWTPQFVALSQLVLAVSLVVLARGIGKEPGITGASRLGRVSLIVFGVSGPVSEAMTFTPVMKVLTSRAYDGSADIDLHAVDWAVQAALTISLLGLAALLVASVVVVRAGTVRGVARWGLLMLGLSKALAFAALQTPLPFALPVLRWSLLIVPLIQLVLGVLLLLQARSTRMPGVTRSVFGAG